MSDRIDPPTDQLKRGPWPPVSDHSRLFDHGWPWCVNAAGHPDPDGGYPNPERHQPAYECHSRAAFLDGACLDLNRLGPMASPSACSSSRTNPPSPPSRPAGSTSTSTGKPPTTRN